MRKAPHAAGWMALVAIVAGVAQLEPHSTVRANASDPLDGAVLKLRLTVASQLPAAARQALVAEADTIWRDGNVRLQWLPGDARVDPKSTLRALVVPRPAAADVDGTRWAVGELIRFEGTSAIAIASIAGAQRVVEESERFQLIESPIGRDQRLGVILGRALAHEIGHYLLRTNTHAPYGLMRANIDAHEFAGPRLGPFRLDREAKAHLAARAAMGPHRFIPASSSGFSYATR